MCLVTQSCLTLWNPTDSSVHQAPLSMGLSRPEYWSGLPCPPPGDLPNPGIEPRSPALQADSLPSEPPGKSKNTGVCSLSILQGIFPTQESNWGLLHSKPILYQLSYQGSHKSSSQNHFLLRDGSQATNKRFLKHLLERICIK